MSEAELTQTVERAAADLAVAPLEPEAGEPRFGREADSGGGRAPGARLAGRLANLLADIRALDDLHLEKAEPATMFTVTDDE